MRADRLLSILLLLQTHRRLTTGELAARLEVSDRTIHRDMESLSAAGVPIAAERGAHGGWSLLEPYQTKLTGLNADEIRALFLTTPANLLTDLGLRGAYEAARIKLEASIPVSARQGADDIRQRILIDLPGWRESAESQEANSCFEILQSAVFNDLRVGLRYQRADGEVVEREVDPLGLVRKGQYWYLVAAVDGEPRTYRVNRVQDAVLLESAVQRPQGFDLGAFWAASQAEFIATLPRYPARISVRQDRVEWAKVMWRFARVKHVDPPDVDGWCVIHVDFETIEEATANIVLTGQYGRVIEPEELKSNVRAWLDAMRVQL